MLGPFPWLLIFIYGLQVAHISHARAGQDRPVRTSKVSCDLYSLT